jgi:energy-coupling factor transporter ATP-binding protein EcfA2
MFERMSRAELTHLELLAELDTLVESIRRWSESPLRWDASRPIRAMAHRLMERLGAMRIRLEAPIVLGVLGGTGVGKSALVNALAGAEVVETGKARPTTGRPILVCRPDWTPELLGIDPASVEVVHRDLPSLAHLVLVDCPDPDTTEAEDAPGSNLARLRQILPHCDALLVVTTQQKYRSARVADELAAAAPGARLVFIQTHADVDGDIRDDWRPLIEARYGQAQIFRIDSLSALADAQKGIEPRGEFAALVDFLTRQVAGSAAARIRRANLLDLVEQTLAACRRRIEEAFPAVQLLDEAILKQRSRLAARLAEQMRSELVASRRQWENRLLGEVLSRWGWSPFSLVLWLYHGMGALLLRGLVFRARTPAQMALWGAVEGVRSWQAYRRRRRADESAAQAVAGGWDEAELRGAALVVEGFANEAGIAPDAARTEVIFQEAAAAATSAADALATELQALLNRAAARHTGWWTRWRYDAMFLAALVGLFFRPAKNFFYDSWLASPPAPLLGLEFYVLSAFWLVVWSGLLLWRFTVRLRRGLKREIDSLAEGWMTPRLVQGIFARLESECRAVDRFRQGLAQLEQHVASLRRQIAQPAV